MPDPLMIALNALKQIASHKEDELRTGLALLLGGNRKPQSIAQEALDGIEALLERDPQANETSDSQTPSYQTLIECLQEPPIVHANILRGTIAKISINACLHLHGPTAIDNWHDMTIAEIKDAIQQTHTTAA